MSAATPHGTRSRGGRGLRLGGGIGVVVLAGIVGAPAQPVDPSAARTIGLVRSHRTDGYVTVAQTLAFAERARPRSFRMARIWAERRADEPFTRVHLCYRLRPPGRPAEPVCGIDYLVSADPAHVEVADAQSGLGRELEAGREAFVRGLDRELALRRDPAATAVRDALDPFNPYDLR
ncbi:hypothetical protein [uncultured Methylobacterium sp.]|uniref:hypothetical protein n=1 Tax=uncultured Methylobacterium sp. TaxID=157278 RepID=UPI0035C96CB6